MAAKFCCISKHMLLMASRILANAREYSILPIRCTSVIKYFHLANTIQLEQNVANNDI